ncbi:uncharacterized protein LOC144373238 isoform X3 [Ictidomys tridecemlineatus]
MAAGAGARARARLCVRAPPECSPRAWRPRLCPGARPARGGRAWSRRVAQPGMETPLDVLSRAASLVHADDEKHKKMEAKRNHETSPRLQHWTVRVGEERLQFHSLPTAGYHKCLQILLEEDNKRWHIRRSYPFSKTSAISLTPHALPQCDFVTYFLLLSQEMKSF